MRQGSGFHRTFRPFLPFLHSDCLSRKNVNERAARKKSQICRFSPSLLFRQAPSSSSPFSSSSSVVSLLPLLLLFSPSYPYQSCMDFTVSEGGKKKEKEGKNLHVHARRHQLLTGLQFFVERGKKAWPPNISPD